MEVRESTWLVERMALIAELDTLGGARDLGYRSTAHWLAVECRMDSRTARDHVRVAHRLESWTLVRDALGEGRLSYSQCRALCRASIEEDQAGLLKVALSSTVIALERHVRALRTAPSADAEVAEAVHVNRYVSWAWDDDGSLRFWGRLDPVDGAALIEAVETGASRIHGRCCEGRPRLGARRADALGEIMRSGCPRTTLMLEAGALRDGPALPEDLVRRLTCDAMVTIKGLNLGRTQRIITPGQRRALEARDGRVCWMPGCDRTHELDGHHIRHWTRGGKTDLDNLLLLCPYHHRLFHEGGWHMSRRRDRIRIVNQHGALVHERAMATRRTQRSGRCSPRRGVASSDEAHLLAA